MVRSDFKQRGCKVKKTAVLLALFLMVMSSFAYADEFPVAIANKVQMKQGMLVPWDDPTGGIENLSAMTLARTMPIESWGRWNALWDGWTLDAGFAYDSQSFNTGALLVGREFGTLGKYLPIDFPLKDKVQVTIYPFGIVATDVFDGPSIHGASGVGIIKFDISW